MPTEYCQESDTAIFTWEGYQSQYLVFNYNAPASNSLLESHRTAQSPVIHGGTSYKIVRPDIRNGYQVNRQVALVKFERAIWNQNSSDDGGTIYEAGGTCDSREQYAAYLTIPYSIKNNLRLDRTPLFAYDIVDDHEIAYHQIILKNIVTGEIVTRSWRPLPLSFIPESSYPETSRPSPGQLNEIGACFDNFTITTLCGAAGRIRLVAPLPTGTQVYLVQVYNSDGVLIDTISRLSPPQSVTGGAVTAASRSYRVDKIPDQEIVFAIENGNCVEIYKKSAVTGVATLVNSFCGLGSSPPAYAVSCGTEDCPPNTCKVDCHTHYCCYNSQGISVFNFLK